VSRDQNDREKFDAERRVREPVVDATMAVDRTAINDRDY
jgi:hypothetical protein